MLAYDKQTLSGAIEILSQSELPDKFEGMKLYGSPEEAKDELCQDCKIFRLSNETGYGRITVYQVFPGIELYYNDMHIVLQPKPGYRKKHDRDQPLFNRAI